MGPLAIAMIVAPATHAITVQTRADLERSLAIRQFSGIGSLAFVSSTTFQSCARSLIASNVVLTAAHCITTYSNWWFVLPPTGDISADTTSNMYGITSSYVIKSYADSKNNTDIAVVGIDRHAFGHALICHPP